MLTKGGHPIFQSPNQATFSNDDITLLRIPFTAHAQSGIDEVKVNQLMGLKYHTLAGESKKQGTFYNSLEITTLV